VRIGRSLFHLGALGMALGLGVLGQGLVLDPATPNLAVQASNFLLYAFPGLAGLWLSLVGFPRGKSSDLSRMVLSHGAALLSVLWLILWCFVWLGMMEMFGEKAEMWIKHSAYLHLFGVGFSMAGYATGWMAQELGKRTLRFLMTPGWAVSYMAWFNLYLQPELSFLWAPAIGGLSVIIGGFLMERAMKREVEAPSRVA